MNVPVVYEINSRPPILPVGNHVQFSNNNSYNNSYNNSNNHSNNVSYKRNITNINSNNNSNNNNSNNSNSNNNNSNNNSNTNTDTNTAVAIANAVANFTSAPGPPISGSPHSPYKSALRSSTGSFTPQRQHSFFNTMQKSNNPGVLHSPTRDITQSSFMSTFTRGNSTIGGMSAYDESNYGGNESTGGNSKDGPMSDPISTRILLSFIDFLDFGKFVGVV